MVDIKSITTEQRNKLTKNLDVSSTTEILKMFNNEDKNVPLAVEKVLDKIALTVDEVTKRLAEGGRLFYIGAGTSGRLGVLDASECVPTFGVSENLVIGIIAGGDRALRIAVEGAEDDEVAGVNDLKAYNFNEKDFVVGLTASGRTPYVMAAMKYARSIGAKAAGITTSHNTPLSQVVDFPIEAVTGAEPLTGSTRMKSGTAQKLILNMISTATMVKLGKVYENLMIDIQMSNDKLVSRAVGIVVEVTGVDHDVAKVYIDKFKSVKHAIFAIISKLDNIEEINEVLNKYNGNIREALKHSISFGG